MRAIRYFWVSFLVLLAATGGVSAQSNVDSRVQKLEETVRSLESRLADLEGQVRERSAPAPIASDKVNWRRLQKGMSAGDVEKLLGSPARVTVFGSFSVWEYGVQGEGTVNFDGRSGAVSGWKEP